MSFFDRFKIFNRISSGVIEDAPEKFPLNVSYGLLEDSKDNDYLDFDEVLPVKIRRSIKNYRYAYHNEPVINAVINNLIINANTEFIIKCNSGYEEARDYIEEQIKEWDLSSFIDNLLKRTLIDGACFVNRYVEDGTLKLKFLLNDGEDYRWKVIRDPITNDILGYAQLIKSEKLPSNWRSGKFEELVTEDKGYETVHFEPEEIVYTVWNNENGDGSSILYPVLDLAYTTIRLMNYIRLSAHKAGSIIGVEIGNENVDSSNVDDGFLNKVMDWFAETNRKDVVVYPYGVSPNVIGNSFLPEYTIPLQYLHRLIIMALLTPESKFFSDTTNKATAKEQISSDTGYKGVIKYIREYITSIVNKEIIDYELSLKYPDAVGNVFLEYVDNINDDAMTLSEIGVRLKSLYPELPSELVIRTYFKEYASNMDKLKAIYGDDWEDKIDKDMGKILIDQSGNAQISTDDWAKTGMNAYNYNLKLETMRKKKDKQERDLDNEDLYPDV